MKPRRSRILNTEFTDVAQVANAARNVEIFRDRPKNEGNNKRDRDGHRIRPSDTPVQVSNQRAYDRRDSDRYGNGGRYGNRDRYGNNGGRSDTQGSDKHGNGSDKRDSALSLSTPMLNSVIISHEFRNCPLRVGDDIRFANLLPLEMSDFDIILGMDWLTEHRAIIDFHSKCAIFGDLNNPEFIYHGSRP
nr:reverse transcriptase domain-containing protein [Tanacetum cinerariifolium]